MEFWQAVQTCFTKYVDFSGRAGRAEYWWFTLFLFLLSIIAGVIESAFFGFELDSPSPFSNAISIGTLLPSLAVSWRRFHDIGKSGWWNLLILTILIIGVIFIWVGVVEDSGLVGVGILATLGSLIWLIVWTVQVGEEGENQYGPDPRALDQDHQKSG